MTTLARRTPFAFSDGPQESAALAQRAPLLEHVGVAFNAMTELDQLRERVLVPFDEFHPRHMLALETLWNVCFPGEAYPRFSERWKEIGFQSTDPVTDLRGGGYLALEHLVRFTVQRRGEGVDDPTFPLGIASISCTAMIARHFALHPTLLLSFPGGGSLPEASTAALRSLLELQHTGTDALQQLHAALLLRLAAEWEALGEGGRPRTIMDFPLAQARAYRALGDATPPGWDAAARTPAGWLDAVCARLERGPAGVGWCGLGGGGGGGSLSAGCGFGEQQGCCLYPGAVLAVLLVLLKGLKANPGAAAPGF